MTKIVSFPGATKLDINPDMILQDTIGELKGCIVIGFHKNGEDYFSSSYADVGDVLYHLERAKWRLMQRLDKLVSDEA